MVLNFELCSCKWPAFLSSFSLYKWFKISALVFGGGICDSWIKTQFEISNKFQWIFSSNNYRISYDNKIYRHLHEPLCTVHGEKIDVSQSKNNSPNLFFSRRPLVLDIFCLRLVDHGRTPRESFFPKIPDFWTWADKVGRKMYGP